jgi:predicted metal-dependent hydrolase
MESLLPGLIARWEQIIGVNVADWGIKKMKTRWGSCNTRARRIWMNLSLIRKPQLCLEYVLVHELVHLLEASHNQRFYALMTQYMPNWREHQLTLEGKRRNKQPAYEDDCI